MDNVVFMIGEKNSKRFFNAKTSHFEERITFNSFFPSKMDCDNVHRAISGSSQRHRYAVIEAEVLGFDGKEIVVAYEDNFREESLQDLQNTSLY